MRRQRQKGMVLIYTAAISDTQFDVLGQMKKRHVAWATGRTRGRGATPLTIFAWLADGRQRAPTRVADA